MSLMGNINYYFLQLFCVRLCKVISDGANANEKITQRGLVYFVKPFSGYNGRPYKFLGDQKLLLLKLLTTKDIYVS